MAGGCSAARDAGARGKRSAISREQAFDHHRDAPDRGKIVACAALQDQPADHARNRVRKDRRVGRQAFLPDDPRHHRHDHLLVIVDQHPEPGLDQIAESNDPLHQPDPAIDVLLAETVGSALQIVIDTMTPAERVAYLLHDAFGFPYSEIGRVLNRTPEAARALASRGRGRIRHTDPGHIESAMPATEQSVVDAFLTAAKGGDVAALVDLLDPQIVERIAIAGQPVVEIRGAESVAGRAREFSSNYTDARSALINGWPGWIAYRDGAVYSVGALAISDGRIVRMDVVLDPARLTDFRIAAPS